MLGLQSRATLTFPAFGHESRVPLNFGAPPHALPVTARGRALDEVVTAQVVPVVVDLVVP